MTTPPSPIVAAVLVAGGSGTRFAATQPKQYLLLVGRPVIRHAAEALAPEVSLLQPVGEPGLISAALEGLAHLPPVAGGTTRQASVLAGLEALAPHAPDIVLVHDAARPVIPHATIAALLAALEDCPGAIPALPVADTLKRATDGRIEATVPRADLFRAQTPQAFRFPLLLALHRAAAGGATDDAAILEAAGHPVALVAGHEDNVKLTYAEDFVRLENTLTRSMVPRVGTGYDVHVLEAGRRLMLCGVEVPHERGLAGHSDADVGIHALCDAIYGALAEGDIGRHFPPSEAAWKDADSARFLTHAAGRVAARGGVLANIDVTLILRAAQDHPARTRHDRPHCRTARHRSRPRVDKGNHNGTIGLHRAYGGHRRPGSRHRAAAVRELEGDRDASCPSVVRGGADRLRRGARGASLSRAATAAGRGDAEAAGVRDAADLAARPLGLDRHGLCVDVGDVRAARRARAIVAGWVLVEPDRRLGVVSRALDGVNAEPAGADAIGQSVAGGDRYAGSDARQPINTRSAEARPAWKSAPVSTNGMSNVADSSRRRRLNDRLTPR